MKLPATLQVLLADDSRTMRALIKGNFIWPGTSFQFIEVDNGVDAVAAYRSRRFDIVLLDIHMPGLDGLRVLSAIRSYDPCALVYMISSDTSMAASGTAQDYGAAVSRSRAHYLLMAFRRQHSAAARSGCLHRRPGARS
jgi:CheY-like chemotaxis protein